MQVAPPTLSPEPRDRLEANAESVSRTEIGATSDLAWILYKASLQAIPASDAADDLVVVIQLRERLDRTDDSYWRSLEDVLQEHGFVPADFGLE